MKVIGKGKYVAVAAMISLLFASPALAQNPDCAASSRQYGDNCDETDVIVYDPTPPGPDNPPVDDVDNDIGNVVIVSPGNTVDTSDAGVAIGPDTSAIAVDETGAPATASAAYPPASSDTSDGGVAVLPDTGGAGWIATVTGAAMISLALISRRLLRRS